MDKYTYLDKILGRYSNTFDIYMPYKIKESVYDAYAFFTAHNEKYVLVKSANMWTTDTYVHTLFICLDEIEISNIEEGKELIHNYFEPLYIRKNNAYPEKNHMSSDIHIIFISEDKLSSDVKKHIKRYQFDKSYKWGFRGYCRGGISAISIASKEVISSKNMKKEQSIFKEVFLEKNCLGFQDKCKNQGVKVFQQKHSYIY